MGRLGLCLIVAVLLVPARATAQNQWQRTVRSQVSEHGNFLSNRGYTMSGDVYDGNLKNNYYEDLTIKLQSGTSYALMGVCDQDCHDIDLRPYDPDGDEVTSDVRTDDWPIVSISPSYGGTYTLRVVMASCGKDPCYYGIGVYTR